MALAKCRECGSGISTSAKICPKCGLHSPTRRPSLLANAGLWKVGLLIVCVIGVVRCFSDIDERSRQREQAAAAVEAAKTPEQKADEARAKAFLAAELAQVLAVLRSVRDSMHNPKSFELVSAAVNESGTVCVVYRGTNAYGGIVTNRVAVMKDMRQTPYSSACSGSLKDVTYARQAL